MINIWFKISVLLALLGPIVAFGGLATYLIVSDIVSRKKRKEQQERFAEVYKMCVDKHGLEFARKVYDSCTKPLWIGMDKMIVVFEHHCGIENELSMNL